MFGIKFEVMYSLIEKRGSKLVCYCLLNFGVFILNIELYFNFWKYKVYILYVW